MRLGMSMRRRPSREEKTPFLPRGTFGDLEHWKVDVEYLESPMGTQILRQAAPSRGSKSSAVLGQLQWCEG